MSDAALRIESSEVWSSRGSAWMISVVLHGGIVVLAMQGLMDLKPRLQPETFQWNVALHQEPPPRPAVEEVSPTQEAIPPPPSSQPAAQPPAPRVQRASQNPVQRTVERTAVVRTGQTVQSRPQAIERVSASERQVMAEEVPAMASRPIQQAVMPQTQEVPPREMREAVQSREQPAMVEQSTAVVSQEPASVVSTESIVEQAPIVESAVVHSEQPSTASMGEPSVERNDPVEVKSAVVHHAAVEHRPVREATPTQADFGWLSESLWKRIEQLKRYPSQARVRRWEGKVVLEAVVRHDGTILECLIAESSGHGLLDQDAISVLRKASPLALKHPLGQDQITILVPIAYRLDS